MLIFIMAELLPSEAFEPTKKVLDFIMNVKFLNFTIVACVNLSVLVGLLVILEIAATIVFAKKDVDQTVHVGTKGNDLFTHAIFEHIVPVEAGMSSLSDAAGAQEAIYGHGR